MPACHAGDRRFESGRVRQFRHLLAAEVSRYRSVSPNSTGHPRVDRGFPRGVRLLDECHARQPFFLFLHYWGIGKAEDLAKGVRGALDATRRD